MNAWLAAHIERRPEPSGVVVVTISLLAISLAFVAVGLLVWGYGIAPSQFYAAMWQGHFSSLRGFAEIGRQTIPLLLTGLGLVIAFRAQFWNIGAEGQLLAGAAAAAGIALFTPVPGPLLIPAMFVAGPLAGALWGLLPTLLKVRLGVNEVITTLMMNYIAIYAIEWLIHGPWKGKSMMGFAYTDTFAEAAWLPLLPQTRLHWPTALLGLTMAVMLALLLYRMRLGYEIRVLGESPEAARYAGINPLRTTVAVMIISAGAAGLAGVGEVAGIHHRLLDPIQISLGYGYTAIIVAWLARGNPLAAILTAGLIGFIFASGDVAKVALRIPVQVVGVMNGLLLLFLISSERLLYYRIRWSAPASPAGRQGSNPATAYRDQVMPE
ncbi:ABC transporter permease [Candidatus Entotheonella palauensis]|uniref:ABC transporter permease n=1 Tax=Candidatus Entotheonella palauensis TaxID=93172 RepID=UPI000B7F26F8|nr:ABC transporter permease [Candidatus Entotheonella palauensis]